MSEQTHSTVTVLSDLQLLRALQERLEQYVQHMLQALHSDLDSSGRIEEQLKRQGLQDGSVPQRLHELLERLEMRERLGRQGPRAQIEQLVHVGELRELVQLVRIAFRVWSSREALSLLRRLEQLAEGLQVELPEVPSPEYETDFAAWAQHQALMVQLGMWEELDQEHLVEELEALSRSDHRELENRLARLTTHLLKWRFDSSSLEPRRLWRATIREQRYQILRLLEQSPSLRPTLPNALYRSYPHARLIAIDETELPDATFPETCPWRLDQIMAPDFWPEEMP